MLDPHIDKIYLLKQGLRTVVLGPILEINGLGRVLVIGIRGKQGNPGVSHN